MKIRDATVEELGGPTSARSRHPERDAAFAEAIGKAKRGKPQVLELTANEKAATVRVAINNYLRRTQTLGVRVRSIGPDSFLIEPADNVSRNARRRSSATV